VFAEANLADGFVAPPLKLAAIPEHKLIHRRGRVERPTAQGRGLLRSFADLRTGDIVVHEDHGLARFAGFDTKTVAGVTRDYLTSSSRARTRSSCRSTSSRRSRATSAPAATTRRSPSSAARAGRR
jgi:hypothetical protein